MRCSTRLASKRSRSKQASDACWSRARDSRAMNRAVSFCSFVAVNYTRSASTPTVLAYAERLRSCSMAFATTHATAARISPCRHPGVLVYGPGMPRSSEYYLTWVDRDGQLRRAVDTPRPFRDPRASPDGKRVAVVIGASTQSDLWLLDANGTLSRLSFDVSPHRPTWTHDGTRITVGAEKSGRWRLLTIPANGTGEPIVLHEDSHRMYPSAWTSDGRHLIFQQTTPANRLGSVPAAGGHFRAGGRYSASVCGHTVSRVQRRDSRAMAAGSRTSRTKSTA